MKDLTEEALIEYQEENAQRLQESQKKSLSLGLDLQGGMRVTLAVEIDAMVKELASEYSDSILTNVITYEQEQDELINTDFITTMVNLFEQRYPDGRLSRYYRSEAENINRRSSNAEVAEYLKKQRSEAIDRAKEIIRRRVDRYGVTE